MCGIAGFVDFNGNSSKELVGRMAATLQHRGPEGQGEYFHKAPDWEIGLGHRRLRIIDLNVSANQPMHYEGLHIVFNGEIYNYKEIREELIKLGHQFQTQSDTEVILHAWRQWGEKAIDKWRGIFAVVLFDEKQQELICIRDRPGAKPFYYYHNKGTFLFGSELKALMVHPEFEKNISRDAVAAFLQYGCVPSPHSIFEHAHKIPAGHLLRLNLANQSVSLKQYWNVYDYYNKPKLRISLPDAIEETERILLESFQYRMVSDVPVGVFLSGGYDSTCITTLLQRNNTGKIKTFTIGTTDYKMDEAPFAKKIANYLDTDHTEYYCTHKEALAIIPELPHYFDEPFADSSAIPTMLVSRLARQRITVALSGDGGDEIFAGYNRYDYINRYSSKLQAIPGPLRKIAATIMGRVASENIPVLRDKPNFHSRYDKLKNLLNDPSASELLKNLSQVFSEKELVKFFTNPVSVLPTAYGSIELKKEYYDFFVLYDGCGLSNLYDR